MGTEHKFNGESAMCKLVLLSHKINSLFKLLWEFLARTNKKVPLNNKLPSVVLHNR